MTIAHVANLGTALSTANNQASLALTTLAAAAAGSVIMLLIAVDNNQATTGASTAVSAVSDAGGSYERVIGYANASAAPANQAGADISIWYRNLTATLASGSVITATFANATLADASAMSARNYSVGAGKVLAVEGTPAGLANNAADPGSLNVTTANIECLRVRGIASESSTATALTVTASWTAFTQAISGAGTSDTEMGVRGEFIINTATGAASDPTLFAADHASAYAAFKEIAGASNKDNAFLVM